VALSIIVGTAISYVCEFYIYWADITDRIIF